MTGRPGTVYLIGAGPGDPGLITRRGAELIASADVVVYDYLANPEFLDWARPGAEVIYVGKKGGDHTMSQADINKLLVDRASQGLSVARLKGGDPFIFGRGGEEAEELVEAGVSFEIVPGVSSTVAGPAYAGIPLTHRSFNTSVTLATGHEDPTKAESTLNWSALAATGGTLVMVMGVKNLDRNSQSLIEAGLPPETPAALIRWATTPRQQVLTATLADIAARAAEAKFGPPSVLVIGGVVGLRDKLAWLEKRPLFGLRVLITRTRSSASRLADLVRRAGGEPIVFPTIKIVPAEDYAPLDKAIGELNEYDWLIMTSSNGVKYFQARLDQAGLDSRALSGMKICAIGPATAQALAGLGLKADLVPNEYKAEDVVADLADEARAGKRFLLPRAAEARPVIPDELTRLGGRVEVVTAYQTVVPDDPDLAGLTERLDRGEVDLALFTASSTVSNLARLFPDRPLSELLQGVKIGAIGPITADTARKHGLTIDVEAAEYTLDGLIEAVIDWRGDL